MNRRDKDVLLALASRGYSGQRDLADACACSLGAVNASVQSLLKEGYLDEDMHLTEKSKAMFCATVPERAVLLAAGAGLRMPHNNTEKPKALLEVRGEPLIERIIRQLHEVGVFEIYVVVGFAKEKFEYLIDRYGVELIVNSQYAQKNNLHSLALAQAYLHNCYIVPCDMWCRENPFRSSELYSWYMVSDAESLESSVRVNRKQELAVVSPASKGNTMIGISYLLEADAAVIRSRLCNMDLDRRYKGSFWEETLYEDSKFRIGPRLVHTGDVVEVNTIEELRELNGKSAALNAALIPEVSRILGVEEGKIGEMTVLKKGMTNCSVGFQCEGQRCIVRIPGDGTDRLIDRKREEAVYEAVAGYAIADDVIYYDPDTGIKISKFLDHVRPCDPYDEYDVKRCMEKLRKIHDAHLSVAHQFDLFEAIDHYEALWGDSTSLYSDYRETKKHVLDLREYIDAQEKDCCLTHIDPVAENFLINTNGADIRLIDWEYAAMQDPHLDIAMFCLHAMYNRQQVDALISAYFPEGCSNAIRLKIYCYIAAGGLLWSNWCEYQCRSGTEFGAYSLRQYRYAKEYYRIVQSEWNK